MIDIYSSEYNDKPKKQYREFKKVTPKYKTVALDVIIWMRDNGVEYKTTDFKDKGYIMDYKGYSAEELFNKFMEEEYENNTNV